MKLKLIVVVLVFSFLACNNQPKANLVVKGKLEGMRKGDLYLQKIEDTLIVSLDSVQFMGDQNFELKAYVEEPQLMFLYLKKFGSEEDAEYLDFFAEEGEFEFTLKNEGFSTTRAIQSPENHQKYEAYLDILKRFKDQNLDLISQQLQTPKDDEVALQEINKKFKSLTRNKYLYTVNYALKNADYEVAPYLVLSEAYDINQVFLDTVYKTLTPKIQASKYGLQLKELMEMRAEEAKSIQTSTTE